MRNPGLFFFAIACMLAMASCGSKTDATANTSDSDSLAIDSISMKPDEVTMEIKTSPLKYTRKLGKWTWSVEADYPVSGDSMLMASVRNYIAETLAPLIGESLKKKLDYKGNMKDGKAVAEYYCSQFFRDINFDDYADLPDDVTCEESFTIKKGYEDDDYLTLDIQIYEYGGGAHGGTESLGRTFDKHSGKVLGWGSLVKKKMTPKLKKIFIAQLKDYFEVKTDDELEENLLTIEDISLKNLPLPQTDPWIDKDGLNFIYQQYEICCYAAGMPGVVIPKNKMGDFIVSE